MSPLAVFQAWMCVCVCVCVGVGKCLISIQIVHMFRLFEFYCECTLIRRNFKIVICVSSVFFALAHYYAVIHSVNCATFI